MLTRYRVLGALVAAWSLSAPGAADAPQATPKDIPIGEFDNLNKLIKPAPAESRWLGMDWLTSVWEARQKAAALGKPILLWSGGGAPPLGGC